MGLDASAFAVAEGIEMMRGHAYAVVGPESAQSIARAPDESQIRRRFELPKTARDTHRRPALETLPPRLSLAAIPRRVVDNSALLALPLDHRTAFVLSQIDGKTTMRTLVDVTGIVADEIVALVERLIELGVIAIR